MKATTEEVLRQALSLDESGRASVAGALIESLHQEEDPDAEEAWDAEIGRRIREIEAVDVAMKPWSEVRQHLFPGYEPRRGRNPARRNLSYAT